MSPMTNGATMAPHDCVEYAMPICAPVAPIAPRWLPIVTNQPPQMKNSRNIIALNWSLVNEVTTAQSPLPAISRWGAIIPRSIRPIQRPARRQDRSTLDGEADSECDEQSTGGAIDGRAHARI